MSHGAFASLGFFEGLISGLDFLNRNFLGCLRHRLLTLAERLVHAARRCPTAASRALRGALALSEAVYRIFSARAAGVDLPDDDLNLLNQTVGDAMCHLRVGGDATGFHWRWSNDRDSLERVVWPVARSAGDLLVSEDLQWVRECASSTCSWLFLDTSRSRRRKWCDMSTCGNREKARRHYRRTRVASG